MGNNKKDNTKTVEKNQLEEALATNVEAGKDLIAEAVASVGLETIGAAMVKRSGEEAVAPSIKTQLTIMAIAGSFAGRCERTDRPVGARMGKAMCVTAGEDLLDLIGLTDEKIDEVIADFLSRPGSKEADAHLAVQQAAGLLASTMAPNSMNLEVKEEVLEPILGEHNSDIPDGCKDLGVVDKPEKMKDVLGYMAESKFGMTPISKDNPVGCSAMGCKATIDDPAKAFVTYDVLADVAGVTCEECHKRTMEQNAKAGTHMTDKVNGEPIEYPDDTPLKELTEDELMEKRTEYRKIVGALEVDAEKYRKADEASTLAYDVLALAKQELNEMEGTVLPEGTPDVVINSLLESTKNKQDEVLELAEEHKDLEKKRDDEKMQYDISLETVNRFSAVNQNYMNEIGAGMETPPTEAMLDAESVKQEIAAHREAKGTGTGTKKPELKEGEFEGPHGQVMYDPKPELACNEVCTCGKSRKHYYNCCGQRAFVNKDTGYIQRKAGVVRLPEYEAYQKELEAKKNKKQ